MDDKLYWFIVFCVTIVALAVIANNRDKIIAKVLDLFRDLFGTTVGQSGGDSKPATYKGRDKPVRVRNRKRSKPPPRQRAKGRGSTVQGEKQEDA